MQRVVIDRTVADKSLVINGMEVVWLLDSQRLYVAGYPKILPLQHVPQVLEDVKALVNQFYATRKDEADNSTKNASIHDGDGDFFSLACADQLSRLYPSICKHAEECQKSKAKQSKGFSSHKTTTKKSASDKGAQKGKEQRDWGDRVDQRKIDALDMTRSESGSATSLVFEKKSECSAPIGDDGEMKELKDLLEQSRQKKAAAATDRATANGSTGFWNRLGSLLSTDTSTEAPITADEMDLILDGIKEHLVSKNVAVQVADWICMRVSSDLVGTSLDSHQELISESTSWMPSFWNGKGSRASKVARLLRLSIESSIRQILLPGQRGVDVLAEIAEKKSKNPGRPFVMVFVGVNGVGKSTSLSKVAYWLLQNGHRVLIVACDTFRAGAVEQLKVHVKNLGANGNDRRIALYERGYNRDDASVAKDAIASAASEDSVGGGPFDVVLVDTAGRMQDNEPLMKSLAKLVTVNAPDRLVFVGEALVGNEAVDQLTKFNKALSEHLVSGMESVTQSKDSSTCTRQIDGLVLSKFDTVDDKVGAALSMTFVSNAPVLFVGTGQTYTDLRRMDVGTVVSSLLDL